MTLRNGRALTAVAGALVSLAVSLHTSPSRALCQDPSSCICSGSIESALIVSVDAVGEAQIEAVVSTVLTRPGETSSFSEGDPLTLHVDSVPDGPPAVGEELLVTSAIDSSGEPQLDVVSRIGADGKVTCQSAPEYRPDAVDAAKHALSDTCSQDVNAEIGPKECNDTGGPFGCSVPGGTRSGGGAAGVVLGLLGLAVAAAARRRRRSG